MPRLTQAASLAFLTAFLSMPTQAASWIEGTLPMVATPLDSTLRSTWSGIKKRNIAPWSDGLLHRPKSESPGDAVSEGQAYGMIAALYQNDQATFDQIWDASENKLWNAAQGYYDWRYFNGNVTGSGLASDADQDIALMLIFADALVKKGIWTDHHSPRQATYQSRAKDMLNTLWTKAINEGNLRPGAFWGGGGTCSDGKSSWSCGNHVNPGYFSPASYRVFAQFDQSHAWSTVVDKSYETLAKSPGYARGLIPDWMDLSGQFVTSGLGYNPYLAGKALYKDAIRVHWRLAMDALWFQEPRAKAFLSNAMAFLRRDPAKADFYQMDGSPLPAADTIAFLKGRPAREHSALTVGMWACAAMAAQGSDSADAWARELLAQKDPRLDFWGWPVDPKGGKEDTAHNEMYFEQFLAWFGTAVMAGRFTNIVADLSSPEAASALAWVRRPDLAIPSKGAGAGGVASSWIRATLSRNAAWAVYFQNHATGAPLGSFTGVGSSIDVQFSLPAEQTFLQVEAHVRVRGLPETTFVYNHTGLRPRPAEPLLEIRAGDGQLHLRAPEALGVLLTDLGGRELLRRDLAAGESQDLPVRGAVLVRTSRAGQPWGRPRLVAGP